MQFDIEYICDEEIKEAILMILRIQFATYPDDIIILVSRLLGYRVTTENIRKRIKTVLDELIGKKMLTLRPNGMIDIKT